MPRILLATATKTETDAVLEVFSEATGKAWQRCNIRGKTYYELGRLGEADIYVVQSETGTATPGGSLLTIHEAIEALRPGAIIMVGIAFGLQPDRQKFGEILVSRQIMSYEPQKRKKKQIIPRGDRVACSTPLLDKFRSGELDWKRTQIHFGLVLSGEKLIDDADFCKQLLQFEPEAIGGEMEGVGLYIAASEAKVDWILVKAICDWADGSKNDEAQLLAARNAADFVRYVIELGGWELRFTSNSSGGVSTFAQAEYSEVVGRENEISQILRFVNEEVGRRKTFVNICGLLGMGKSTVAASVYEAIKAQYQLLWIECEQYASLDDVWPDIAKLIGRDSVTTEDFAQLLSQENLLVVFDGADNLPIDKFLRQIRPLMSGKVLLTRCKSTDFHGEYQIKIPPLSPQLAFDLFLSWWGKTRKELDELERNDILAICNRYTGYIPQAIKWIGLVAKDKGLDVLCGELNNPEHPIVKDELAVLNLIYKKILDNELDNDGNEQENPARTLLGRMLFLGAALSEKNIGRMAMVGRSIEHYRNVLNKLEELQLVTETMGDNARSMYYKIPYNVQLYMREKHLGDIENIQELKKVAAKCVFESNSRASWPLGLQHLFDAGEWEMLLFQANDKLKIEENERIFPQGDKELLEARAHWAMAYYHQRVNDFESAIEETEYKSHLKCMKNGGDNTKILSLLLRLNNIQARSYYCLDNPDLLRTETVLAESEQLLRQINPTEQDKLSSEIAQFNLWRGFYESEREGGSLHMAIEYTQRALDAFAVLGDEYQFITQTNLAAIYSQIAENLKSRGEAIQSEEYELKSIELSKDVIKKARDPYIVASEYANLVLTYYKRKDYERAHEVAVKGEEYCDRHYQTSVLPPLLLTAADVDMARSDAINARLKIEKAHQLKNLMEDVNASKISFYAAWSKLLCLEASLREGEKTSKKKRKEACEFYQKAKKQALKTGNQQHEEILADAEKWLVDLGCMGEC